MQARGARGGSSKPAGGMPATDDEIKEKYLERAIRELNALTREIQKLTPSCDALWVPDIDASLDDEQTKREFWKAFRALGDWYADLPPY